MTDKIKAYAEFIGAQVKDAKEAGKGIDELSKKTLGSYVHKAGESLAVAHGNVIKQRAVGDAIDNATNTNDIDYKTKNTLRDTARASVNKNTEPLRKTIYKRQIGIPKALSRLTKEEAERVDELSKMTVGHYIRKSADAMGDHKADSEKLRDAKNVVGNLKYNKSTHASNRDTEERIYGAINRSDRKVKNRARGIETAVKKLGGGVFSNAKIPASENKPYVPKTPQGVLPSELANRPGRRHKFTGTLRRSTREQVEVNEDGLEPVGASSGAGKSARAPKSGKSFAASPSKKFKTPAPMKEDVLNELSKKTLGSYVKKAAKNVQSQQSDYTNMARDWEQGENREMPTRHERMWEKGINKRHKGIARAVKRLTKEETIVEASKTPVGILADAVRQHTHADAVGVSKGHVIARRGFFYSHGQTSERHAKGISDALTLAGVKHTVVEHGQHDAPFRGGSSIAQGSHFWVKLKPHTEVKEDVELTPEEKAFVAEINGYLPHAGPRTSALLPTGTMLHPHEASKNEFHKTWREWDSKKGSEAERAGGTYLLLQQKHHDWKTGQTKVKHAILSGSGGGGDLENNSYPKVGDKVHGHHDQTMRGLGEWDVIHKTSHRDAHTLPIKKAPLWVYK